MSNKAARSKADVLQGTLDMMVLQTLDSLGPLHGYAIAARLEQVSGGAAAQYGHAPSADAAGAAWPAPRELGHHGDQSQSPILRGHAGGRASARREKHAWDRMAGIIHTLLHGET